MQTDHNSAFCENLHQFIVLYCPFSWQNVLDNAYDFRKNSQNKICPTDCISLDRRLISIGYILPVYRYPCVGQCNIAILWTREGVRRYPDSFKKTEDSTIAKSNLLFPKSSSRRILTARHLFFLLPSFRRKALKMCETALAYRSKKTWAGWYIWTQQNISCKRHWSMWFVRLVIVLPTALSMMPW